MLGRIGDRKLLLSESRVMNHDGLLRDRLQDHEVIHVPVHDRRQVQLWQMVELEAQRTANQVEMGRHLDQGAERGSFQRYGMATSERVQVDTVPVVRGDHRQASEPAFRRLGLYDDRQPVAGVEVQHAWPRAYILALSSGSRSQCSNERLSRITSALRSMPACSGHFLPYASTSGRSSAAVTL